MSLSFFCTVPSTILLLNNATKQTCCFNISIDHYLLIIKGWWDNLSGGQVGSALLVRSYPIYWIWNLKLFMLCSNQSGQSQQCLAQNAQKVCPDYQLQNPVHDTMFLRICCNITAAVAIMFYWFLFQLCDWEKNNIKEFCIWWFTCTGKTAFSQCAKFNFSYYDANLNIIFSSVLSQSWIFWPNIAIK